MGSLKYKLGAKGNDRVEDSGILKAIHEWGVFSLGISCHHFIFLLAAFTFRCYLMNKNRGVFK